MNLIWAGMVGAAMFTVLAALTHVSMSKFHWVALAGAIVGVLLELIGIQVAESVRMLLSATN